MPRVMMTPPKGVVFETFVVAHLKTVMHAVGLSLPEIQDVINEVESKPVNELESKIISRFRELGDRFLSKVPNWENSEFSIGNRNRVTSDWIEHLGDGGLTYTRYFHHQFQLCPDFIIEARAFQVLLEA
ncbi:hypothetical protein [Aureimonas glaciei]|uniref:Uncharacterized protein n=1 Tax=Aureimonas glaciei TaxID=1776957 RepID=A0A916YG80_9HYPH|nr:hypothetical protein [Aureimonas glaciei]GGD43966.1 hypothetical protein GCM10011335_53240 [Aureimonas glaciei]